MKIKRLVFAMAVVTAILAVLASCGAKETGEVGGLRVGTYQTEDGFEWVQLNENGGFVYNRGIALSYRPTGTYAEVDGKLVLTVVEDEVYTFAIHDGYITLESWMIGGEIVNSGSQKKFIYQNDTP